jgi:hypothetical protein
LGCPYLNLSWEKKPRSRYGFNHSHGMKKQFQGNCEGNEKFQPKKILNRLKNVMRSMSTKHKIMWDLKLDNTCDATLEISKCLKN